jgi:hypothetical protein
MCEAYKKDTQNWIGICKGKEKNLKTQVNVGGYYEMGL